MLNEIYDGVFLNEVVLPKNPLKALNCYLIKGKDRILVVDSGFDTKESEDLFFQGLEEIGAEIGKTDMLITHLHADHSGLAFKFQQKYKGNLYASECDLKFMNRMHEDLYNKQFMPILKLIGIDDGEEFFETHPGLVYCMKERISPILVKEGDVIDLGNFKFEVVEVPGHTPGHVALYERDKKIFFGGDHILNKITPNISFWGFEFPDILGTYINSLYKIYNLDIKLVFSAHRNIVEDPKLRINQLLKHYHDRNEEVLQILRTEAKEMTSVEMARKMHWDFRAPNFDAFPNNQKWFAGGEALANLEHLVYTHLATKEIRDGIAYYKAF